MSALLGCQVALTAIYAIVFFCVKVMYPYLRGAGSVALAFVTMTIANVLLLLSDSLPPFVSIVISHCFLLSAFVLFYTGVLHFFKSPRKIRYAWALTIVASVLIAYLILSHDRTKALIFVIAISFFLLRGVIAVEIFRQAADRIFLKIFAYVMAAYAIFALNRLLFMLVVGAPPNQAQREFLQTVSVLLSVTFAFLIGLSFLLMLCSELLTLVKDESERDLLSGVLNRRGIEQKLDLELKRGGRSGQSISIALIDIDHFKTINDSAGHEAGDTRPPRRRLPSHAKSARVRPPRPLRGRRFLISFLTPPVQEALVVALASDAVRDLSIPDDCLPDHQHRPHPGRLRRNRQALSSPRADKALYHAKDAGRNCCRVLLTTQSMKARAHVILPTS
jgi:GGDEF domain-containing protein